MADQFNIVMEGSDELLALLREVERRLTDKTELHGRFGIRILNWIDRNFQQEGRLTGRPWAPLSRNTILARRKGSSRILQDTGGLKGSFHERHDNNMVKVWSSKEIAIFHQFGTSPYTIVPKNAKALAFKGEGATNRVSASFSSIATKATYKKGDKFVIVKKVNHPGLQARPMLPTVERATPILVETARNYLREIIGRTGRFSGRF